MLDYLDAAPKLSNNYYHFDVSKFKDSEDEIDLKENQSCNLISNLACNLLVEPIHDEEIRKYSIL